MNNFTKFSNTGESFSNPDIYEEDYRENKNEIKPGDKFGIWTVIEQDKDYSSKRKKKYYLCTCDNKKCKKIIQGYVLHSNRIPINCNCTKEEKAKEKQKVQVENLIGNGNEKWTVIKRIADKKQTDYWELESNCDNKCHKITSGNNIRKNIWPKKCNCEMPKQSIAVKDDITGNIYGRWTVLQRADDIISPNGVRESAWLCECNCEAHTKKEVSHSDLICGYSKSCGCLSEEIKLDRYHRKAIQKHRINEDTGQEEKICSVCLLWKPLTRFKKLNSAIDGYYPSCKDCRNAYEKTNNDRKKVSTRYYTYKRGAIIRKLDFNLSKEEFDELTSKPCEYCGEYTAEIGGIPYTGIDRKDSNLGYFYENCVSCCTLCNTMKSNLTKEEWINHMEKILNHIHNTEGQTKKE